jgi:hypothetical protein
VEQQREYSNHTCTNRGDIDAATLAGCIYRLNYMTSRKFDSPRSNKTQQLTGNIDHHWTALIAFVDHQV